jgi:hypothetical protein
MTMVTTDELKLAAAFVGRHGRLIDNEKIRL